MSPQEFWLLVAELAPAASGGGAHGSRTGPDKIGTMDRATFDALVSELNA